MEEEIVCNRWKDLAGGWMVSELQPYRYTGA